MAFLTRLNPFLMAGLCLAILVFGLVIFAYILLIGTLIAAGLVAINWLRSRFLAPPATIIKKPTGRIIDSNEWHKL